MPFDSATFATEPKYKAEIAALEKLEALFADPRNWCQDAFARTTTVRAGRKWLLLPRYEQHTSYCLIGGLAHVTDADPMVVNEGGGPETAQRVKWQLRALAGERIPDFNDTHDHAAILGLLARARSSFQGGL
jgi:hypothetical protein